VLPEQLWLGHLWLGHLSLEHLSLEHLSLGLQLLEHLYLSLGHLLLGLQLLEQRWDLLHCLELECQTGYKFPTESTSEHRLELR